MPGETNGLLVIRAWLEDGSPSPLRAEIRLTADVSRGVEERLTVTEVEAVVAAVRSWLERLTG